MQIINTHCHLIEIDKALDKESGDLELMRKIPSVEKAEEIIPFVTATEILLQMDEAGILQTVLFALICPILYASNEFVYSICKKYPDRFIGFASVNPHKKNAVETLEKAIINYQFNGIKFHPPLQNFYPNDQKIYPIYELAIKLNVPIVFHVGSTPFGNLTLLKQADPILLDEVAVKFPKLKIVLTHLGTLWHNEAFMVVEKNPNVYIDTAAYPYEIKELLTKKTIERVGENKFIFGTDFPMPYEGKYHEMKDFVECINSLDITNIQKEKIFYKNFQTLISS
ncbi:amidohydrolase family protein [Bacteroidota bacterium]